MKALISIIFAILIAGCSRTELLDKIAPEEMKAQAIQLLEALRKGTGLETYALLSEEQKSEEVMQTLALLAKGMPDKDYTDMTFVNYQWQKRSGQEYYYFVFEYNFDGVFLLADITLKKGEENVIISGLHVNQIPESVVESSRFDFEDAGVVHLIFIGGVIILPIFSIVTLITCIRTKGIKRKWLWCIFILVGFMSFKINWTSGEWSWQPIAFQILSGSAFSSGAHGPWVISISVPFGAVAFWDKRRKIKAQPVAGGDAAR